MQKNMILQWYCTAATYQMSNIAEAEKKMWNTSSCLVSQNNETILLLGVIMVSVHGLNIFALFLFILVAPTVSMICRRKSPEDKPGVELYLFGIFSTYYERLNPCLQE